MKKLRWIVVAALLAAGAQADISDWLTAAQATGGNVTASDNGGAGWTLDGTAGFAYDYGALDQLDGKPVDGGTVEFIFNLSNSGSSIALGAMTGWSPGNERLVFKLEQWPDTGKFGITAPGVIDSVLTTDSVFDETIHVVFVRNNDGGTIDLYVNGAFATTDSNKTNWRMDGGPGYIGSNFAGTGDVATGTFFGVASYDAPLNATQISSLYNAYTIPEPNTLGMVAVFGGGMLLIRRKFLM